MGRCPFVPYHTHCVLPIGVNLAYPRRRDMYSDVIAAGMLRWADRTPWELGFNKRSFTMHTGLAGQMTLHTFKLSRVRSMLLSSLGFPSQ
jgi:hypothetical protein